MPDREVMPLIAFDQWSKRSHVEQQRDADQKVLESAQVMMDSMIKLIEKLEAKEKEWAKKEADWLGRIKQEHCYSCEPDDPCTQEAACPIIQAIFNRLAELRKVSGEK